MNSSEMSAIFLNMVSKLKKDITSGDMTSVKAEIRTAVRFARSGYMTGVITLDESNELIKTLRARVFDALQSE